MANSSLRTASSPTSSVARGCPGSAVTCLRSIAVSSATPTVRLAAHPHLQCEPWGATAARCRRIRRVRCAAPGRGRASSPGRRGLGARRLRTRRSAGKQVIAVSGRVPAGPGRRTLPGRHRPPNTGQRGHDIRRPRHAAGGSGGTSAALPALGERDPPGLHRPGGAALLLLAPPCRADHSPIQHHSRIRVRARSADLRDVPGLPGRSRGRGRRARPGR